MSQRKTVDLHIPEGIRFSCSGCGNCCHAWPVPLTSGDYLRLERLAPEVDAGFAPVFARPYASPDDRYHAFTHTLEKLGDGRCQFLTQDERCRLQELFGQEAKPSMCRLFPYAFTRTPAGVYASLSFASSAVLYNCGELLSRQEDLLREHLALYEQLFGFIEPNWSRMQLLDGVPLSWERYLELDTVLLSLIGVPGAQENSICSTREADSGVESGAGGGRQTYSSAANHGEGEGSAAPGAAGSSRTCSSTLNERDEGSAAPGAASTVTQAVCGETTLLESRMLACSQFLVEQLPAGFSAEKDPPLEARPKIVDEILLDFLDRLYLPERVFQAGGNDLDARALASEIVRAPDVVTFGPGRVRFGDLVRHRLAVPAEVDDLLHRFVYCRIFGKLYFGPNLGHLSVIAGLHHLLVLIVILRLRLKVLVLQGGDCDLSTAAELVRTLERRLTQLSFASESMALLEVLLSSPARMQRLVRMAA